MGYVLNKDWSEILAKNIDVDFKKKLFDFINHEYATKTVYPPKEKIFNRRAINNFKWYSYLFFC